MIKTPRRSTMNKPPVRNDCLEKVNSNRNSRSNHTPSNSSIRRYFQRTFSGKALLQDNNSGGGCGVDSTSNSTDSNLSNSNNNNNATGTAKGIVEQRPTILSTIKYTSCREVNSLSMVQQATPTALKPSIGSYISSSSSSTFQLDRTVQNNYANNDFKSNNNKAVRVRVGTSLCPDIELFEFTVPPLYSEEKNNNSTVVVTSSIQQTGTKPSSSSSLSLKPRIEECCLSLPPRTVPSKRSTTKKIIKTGTTTRTIPQQSNYVSPTREMRRTSSLPYISPRRKAALYAIQQQHSKPMEVSMREGEGGTGIGEHEERQRRNTTADEMIALQEWKLRYYEENLRRQRSIQSKKRETEDTGARQQQVSSGSNDISVMDPRLHTERGHSGQNFSIPFSFNEMQRNDVDVNVSSKPVASRNNSSSSGSIERGLGLSKVNTTNNRFGTDEDYTTQGYSSSKSRQNFLDPEANRSSIHFEQGLVSSPPFSSPPMFSDPTMAMTKSTSIQQLPTIELCAGVHVRFRGAKEIYKAVENDSFVPCFCPICEKTMYCIEDASSFLCPLCRVVNPLSTTTCTAAAVATTNTMAIQTKRTGQLKNDDDYNNICGNYEDHRCSTNVPQLSVDGNTTDSATCSSINSTTNSNDICYDGGVGLGFTFDDLIMLREQILHQS